MKSLHFLDDSLKKGFNKAYLDRYHFECSQLGQMTQGFFLSKTEKN